MNRFVSSFNAVIDTLAAAREVSAAVESRRMPSARALRQLGIAEGDMRNILR